MNSERYSLCMPYINYVDGKVDKHLWRIADFDSINNKLVKAIYSDREEILPIEDYLPRKIRAMPYGLQPYRIEFRQWQAFQSETGIFTESERVNGTPYEIVFYEGINIEKHNSDSDIRSILYNGIHLLEYTGDYFLLIVNKTSAHYEALLCSKKEFSTISGTYKIEKNCQDILKTTHGFELYSIAQNDIIDTAYINIYFSQNEKVPVRYFYCNFELKCPERKVFLRSPENYAQAYVSKYLKNKRDILKITKSEAKKMVTIIEDALKNKEEFEAFFQDTGFKFSDVEYALTNLSDEVQEIYMQNDIFSQIVERSLLNDPFVREKCIEEAKKIWLLESDEQRQQVEKYLVESKEELAQIQKDCELTLSNILINKETISMLESKKNALEQDCKNIEVNNAQIKKDIEEKLKHFQSDVVHLAELSALSGANSASVSNIGLPQPIYVLGNKIQNDEPTIAENLMDFTDDLQVNLMICGMNKDYAYGFSQLIISSITCRKHFVVCGGKSEDVANSLALLLQSKYADQIFLPSGFTDISSLINKINSMDGHVILIHNALETYSESVFMAIVKMCKGKIIVFSCEDETTYFNLPSHWGQYVIYLAPELTWNTPKSDELLTGRFDFGLFKYELKEDKSNGILKIIKLFSTKKVLNAIQSHSISEILIASQSIYNQCGNMKLAILNNLYLLTLKRRSDFAECLDVLDISDDMKQIVLREVSYE